MGIVSDQVELSYCPRAEVSGDEKEQSKLADTTGRREWESCDFCIYFRDQLKISNQDENDSCDARETSTDGDHFLSTERGGSGGRRDGSGGESSRSGVGSAVCIARSGGEGDVRAADVGRHKGRGEGDVGALVEGRISSVVNYSVRNESSALLQTARNR